MPPGRGRGGSLPQGLRVQGPSSPNIIIFYSFISDVIKEPPNRSSLQGSESQPDSVPPESLAFCPSARFNHRQKGPRFAVLPLSLKHLSAALDAPNKIVVKQSGCMP